MTEDRRARALLTHRYLFRLALATGNVFAWIVVFRVFYLSSADIASSLAGVTALFMLTHLISFILMPLGGAALRHGTKRALVLGSVAAAISYAFLAELFLSSTAGASEYAFWLISGFVILNGIHRALYYLPYAAATQAGPSAKHIFLREASLALVPLIAGFFIARVTGGGAFLFCAAAAIAALSVFVLARAPEVYERFDWAYGETMGALFSRFHRRALWTSILDGAQGAVLFLVWPLAAFLILGQSFFALGVVLSFTFFAAFIGRSLVRRIVRYFRADRAPVILATIAFTSWILRIGAGTPFQIILADVYYHAGAEPRRRGIDAHSHDQWADRGHYIDEFTALKEMGLAMGRILVCLVFILLVFVSIPALAFTIAIFLAAVAAAISILLSHRLSKEAL